mmetsp:Transcript_13337/g.29159  ORF Transcript_13337/g.29159 Transcript_13337/m.29159 type:complete len:98 (+) Transcript_13337:271-564(+)
MPTKRCLPAAVPKAILVQRHPTDQDRKLPSRAGKSHRFTTHRGSDKNRLTRQVEEWPNQVIEPMLAMTCKLRYRQAARITIKSDQNSGRWGPAAIRR